jgi:hypothetical protein
MSTLHPLTILGDRLKRIGIDVEFVGNYPWIYLHTINGIRVQEKTPDSNHGFTIAWLPVRNDKPFRFDNTKEMFELIRKYIKEN